MNTSIGGRFIVSFFVAGSAYQEIAALTNVNLRRGCNSHQLDGASHHGISDVAIKCRRPDPDMMRRIQGETALMAMLIH